MILIDQVTMRFPKPRRYKDYVLMPFAKPEFATALKNISLEVKDGDRLALLGANGAGKTTLLKLVGGLLYPTEGKVTINGHDTTRANQRARKSVGFVLNEERSFYWRMTGRQNLQFFGALDNLRGEELDGKINELLVLVGMDQHADKPFGNYSSGMKQRLAIARGLISDPEILILDEPTRTLDPIAAIEMKELILEKIHGNRTLLIATHRLDEALSLCNRVLVVRTGDILLNTSMEDAISTYGSLENCYQTVIVGEGRKQ